MLPDICFNTADNWNDGSGGNPDFGGGVDGGAELLPGNPDGGVRYPDNKLASGGCVGRPVLSTMAQTRTEFIVGLYDSEDQPVDLTNTDSVVFLAKEMTYVTKFYIDKPCEITDATAGQVKLVLEIADVPYAGLWEASFQLRDASGGTQVEFRIYLELLKGLHQTRADLNEPLTIGEIRMAMFDRCPKDNEFLDDVEFKDSEIVYAIRRAVDMWNEQKPIIQGYQYTMATFPYRYNGANAAAALLMLMKGNNLMRNRMPFSTGMGVIDDKERANPYIKIGEQMLDEYKRWMVSEKHRINAENCYGVTSRPSVPIVGHPRNTR